MAATSPRDVALERLGGRNSGSSRRSTPRKKPAAAFPPVQSARTVDAGALQHLTELHKEATVQEQRHWDEKYATFSGRHMMNSFTNFKHAQQDPFSKAPDWGEKILAHVAAMCRKAGLTAEDLLTAAGVAASEQRRIGPDEVRRVLLRVKRDLSDAELKFVFDAVDTGRRGQISWEQLCSALSVPSRTGSSSAATAAMKSFHRPPVFRLPAHPPSVGANPVRLLEDAEHARQAAKMPSAREVDERLQAVLASPREEAKFGKPPQTRYEPLGDTGRFERAWKRRQEVPPVHSARTPVAVELALICEDLTAPQERWVWDPRQRRKVCVPLADNPLQGRSGVELQATTSSAEGTVYNSFLSFR
eukprot:TRINITY_DN113775_c0_g1_i1.p1 TRINITY_DN113775_c0_g1~~TRINITY_DN113775_c0_g1_i1.p1  ORF type:complete len:360 (-),score=70.29 TRINITY_DN113775_c0_g1_i1:168-1247(-)